MDQYIFVKMIDSDKNVSIVRNTKDGKNYVQKEHKYYNKSIFEQLKGHFNGIPRIYECIESGNKLITIEDYIQRKHFRIKNFRFGERFKWKLARNEHAFI